MHGAKMMINNEIRLSYPFSTLLKICVFKAERILFVAGCRKSDIKVFCLFI